MSGSTLRHALLAAALLLAAIIGACTDRADARFPHRLHLAGIACGGAGQPACLDCNSCHTMSAHDRVLALPPGAECSKCHVDDAAAVQPLLAVDPPRPTGEIGFEHDRHLAMPAIQGQCMPCHAGLMSEGASTLPSMATCFGCHEHQAQWKAGTCAPCHLRSELERTLPRTFLRHDAAFARRHGQAALDQKQLCQSCHSQSQCADCHDVSQDLSIERRLPDGIDRSRVHPGDFMVRHSIEAAAQPSRCVRCHTVETCDTCHVERGVSANRRGSANPHPPGWVGSNAASRSFHGVAARRDIVGCASCHDQGPATNCIRCHQVGGFGGNPHPGGWRSTRSQGEAMCRYCHG